MQFAYSTVKYPAIKQTNYLQIYYAWRTVAYTGRGTQDLLKALSEHSLY